MQSAFLGVQASYENARIVMVPAPYDATTTYMPGSRFGPRSIINASQELELYDREMGFEVAEKIGIHTLPCLSIWDLSSRMLSEVQDCVHIILDQGKIPFLLGGDHSLTLGAVHAALRKHPDLCVVQMDAHADLRDEYQGNRFNHACVGRRVEELAPLLQAGVRSICQEEADWIAQRHGTVTGFVEDLKDPAWWPSRVEEIQGRPVYLTIDLDVLDPAVMPSTGTPEPGGLLWQDLISMICLLSQKTKIVAADCMELCPTPGLHAPDFTAAKLVYKAISYIADAEDKARVHSEI